jgi:hypothetical protein
LTKRISYLAECSAMNRGIEVGLHLRPGLPNENFVAEALGNLAAFGLEAERRERLEWRIVRVETGQQHHFRLILRHPDRLLDLGFKSSVEAILRQLSDESVDDLRTKLSAAETQGLRLVPLRTIQEPVDFWRDDFWNWFG